MPIKQKTMMDRMNAEKPDDVLADLEAKHGSQQRMVRPRKHHVLKCWPEPFNAIGERRKLFELRIDDRDFQEGDSAELREWNPETQDYTQRWIFCKIGYVLREPFKFPGVKPGFCVWTIILPANHQWPIPQWPNDDSSDPRP